MEKNFDCIFEFSMKSCVRNTINISCAKIVFPSVIDQIHELILDDRRISAKSIAEQLGISCERVGSIIRIIRLTISGLIIEEIPEDNL